MCEDVARAGSLSHARPGLRGSLGSNKNTLELGARAGARAIPMESVALATFCEARMYPGIHIVPRSYTAVGVLAGSLSQDLRYLDSIVLSRV
jgi:hypothetical protein